MNLRFRPLIAIAILSACGAPNGAKTPSPMLGPFRVCGPYACTYIEVHGDGYYVKFGTGEMRLYRTTGTWSPWQTTCIRLQPTAVPERESVLDTPKMPTQPPPPEEWCLENGKHILRSKSGIDVEFEPVPPDEYPPR